MIWLAALAVLLILIGLRYLKSGEEARQERGLSQGETLDLDTRTFYSARFKLAGRPDRLFRDGEATIPVEWKKSRQVWPSHRAQLATYFILIEEETGVPPPYGIILLGSGERLKVKNTPDLQAWALDVAEQIRAGRRQLADQIQVNQSPGKCRACGMREGLGGSSSKSARYGIAA